MENVVIKVLNEEHGQKVKQYFESIDINTIGFNLTNTENKGNTHIYYGIISEKGKDFRCYHLEDVKKYNVKIIELPEECEFKRGDTVLVSDDEDFREQYQYIYLTEIKGADFPFRCVADGQENNFYNDNKFCTAGWKYCKAIPKPEKINLSLKETIEIVSKSLGHENFNIIL